MKKLLLSVFALFMIAGAANAQVAVRANLAYLPFGTLQLGAEFALSQKWTLGVDGLYSIVSPYDFYELKGGTVSLETRYYFCEVFNKHHIGFFLTGGYFDSASLSNKFVSNIVMACENAPHLFTDLRHIAIGFAGLSYGYYIKLQHGWGIDLSIGGGCHIARYDSQRSDRRPYTNLHWGVSKVGVDLSYKF